MKINRKLQHEVLIALQKVYPDSLLVQTLPDFSHDRDFMGNLFYLQEHGLIEGGDIREPGQCRSMVDVQITKCGLDFLADDGGLSAILAPFTLRFNSGEILDAFTASLNESTIPQEKRVALLQALKDAEPEELKAIIEKLIHLSVHQNMEFLSSLLQTISPKKESHKKDA